MPGWWTIKNRNLFPSNNNVLQSGDGEIKQIGEGRLKTRPLLSWVTQMTIFKFDLGSHCSSAVKWEKINENNQKIQGLLPSLGKIKIMFD